MVSRLLLYKILQLFIFMVLGFLLVKLKVVKSQDSRVLSKLSLYLFMPAVILNAFNMEMTDEVVSGLTLAFVVAVLIHILLLGLDFVFQKAFRCAKVERASIMYSNAGNLIIPIVLFILGEEWIVYSCAYLIVQLIFLWTHGVRLFSKDATLGIKKIFLNVNMITIIISFILMFSGLRLPAFVSDISSDLGSMLAPAGMLVAGMLAAELNIVSVLKNKRLYFVMFARLILCPAVVLLLIKSILMFVHIENADEILLISYLASITPSASTVMQFAQIYHEDADYAVAINIATTVVCVLTMPLFVLFF